MCVSQFCLAFCLFSKFFQIVFVFTFYYCVILQFLCPRNDRSGAYCFTVVCLSVCLSAENLICELNIFLLHQYASAGTKVKVICQGQGRISTFHFSKHGRFRDISISQTHLVFNSTMPSHIPLWEVLIII